MSLSLQGLAIEYRESFYLEENRNVFHVIVVLAVLGNTLAPLGLTILAHTLYTLTSILNVLGLNRSLKYIIDNPRRVSTLLFSYRNLFSYLILIFTFDVTQYVLYLLISIFTTDVLEVTSVDIVLFFGFYQTIFNRTAGIKIFPDFHLLGKINLTVYCGINSYVNLLCFIYFISHDKLLNPIHVDNCVLNFYYYLFLKSHVPITFDALFYNSLYY
jgi:hypothetical protein